MKDYDVCIVGAGVAGITASIYCARANLKVALIDKSIIGGNLNNYMNIENYPAFFGETSDLVDKLQEHIEKYSDNIDTYEFEEIEYVDVKDKYIKTKNNEFQGKYLILATGSKPRMLNVPGEKEFIGNGVHYCAICDGILYKDKTVAVVGGGNSACEEALGLSKICKEVHIIEFTDKLNADKVTLDKIKTTKNIKVWTSFGVTSIEQLSQEELVNFNETGKWFAVHCKPSEDLTMQNDSSDVCLYATKPNLKLWVNGIFVYIGMSPNLPEFKEKPPAVIKSDSGEYMWFFNDYDYIITDDNMETVIEGIYAVGDIREKDYRQVITAMSDGAIASIHISKRV